jgi:hypothetical protein
MADGVIITHPNRDKASSKSTRVVVVLLLLISAALMAVVTIGGWDLLVGATPVTIAYILIYVLVAYFVGRWNRGVLPVIAALAIIMAIFCAVAAPEWFARDKTGFAEASLSNTTLGLLTAIIIPVQLLLVGFAMSGFRQAWNVEVERREGDGGVVGTPPVPPAGPARPLAA